jgi:hypothetical protein
LLPALRAYVRKCPDFLYVQNDPHFNTTGHQLAGHIIARVVGGVAGIAVENQLAWTCPAP